MCTRRDVEAFAEILGLEARRYQYKKRRAAWIVEARSQGEAKRVIEMLLPWLRGKREQAEVLLGFLRLREEGRDRGATGPYTAEERAELERVHQALKRLKKEEG